MRVAAVFLALSYFSSLTVAAPYHPSDGQPERSHRRAAHYPVQLHAEPQALRARAPKYSVVPVSGDPTSAPGAPPPAITVTRTVKRPPVVKTVISTEFRKRPAVTAIHTKVVTEEQPDRTIKVTITKPSRPGHHKPPVVATQTGEPGATKAFDDGQWHTSYANPTATGYFDSGQWHPPYDKHATAAAATPSSATSYYRRDLQDTNKLAPERKANYSPQPKAVRRQAVELSKKTTPRDLMSTQYEGLNRLMS